LSQGAEHAIADQFPRDAKVIIDDVKRFRALSPDSRVRLIAGLVTAGALMMRQST
jgi:hypothetical protein